MSLSELARLRDRFKAKGSAAATSSTNVVKTENIGSQGTHDTSSMNMGGSSSNSMVGGRSSTLLSTNNPNNEPLMSGIRAEVFKSIRLSVHRCLATVYVTYHIPTPLPPVYVYAFISYHINDNVLVQ
jgi:hypothetical protein